MAIQAASKTAQKGATKVTVNKENTRLATELDTRKSEAQTKEQQIRESLMSTEQTAAEIERVVQQTEEVREQLAQVQQSIDLRNLERERIQEEKARKDRTLQHLRDAKDGRYKLTTGPRSWSSSATPSTARSARCWRRCRSCAARTPTWRRSCRTSWTPCEPPRSCEYCVN
jgi:chromosome segregation ATPase